VSVSEITIRVLLAASAFIALIAVLVAVVLKTRRGGNGVHAIGAALMLFGWGNLRDPGSNPVAEAKDGRVRKSNYSGDPLDPDQPK
jgi:hypothetical protein